MNETTSIQDFMNFIGSLEQVFGRKYLPSQVGMFYDQLKHIPKIVFTKTLPQLCLRSRYLPDFNTIEDFVFRELRAQKHDIPEPVTLDPKKCPTCFGTGIVEAIRIEGRKSESSWLFKCSCSYGEAKRFLFKPWIEADQTKFKLRGA